MDRGQNHLLHRASTSHHGRQPLGCRPVVLADRKGPFAQAPQRVEVRELVVAVVVAELHGVRDWTYLDAG